MKTILTLCIGNICRSPLAQGLLAQRLPQHTVWSAGLVAMVGQAADPMAVALARDHGLDITAHRAQQISFFLCQCADLILVMERSHKAQLEAMFPQVRGKTFCLGQYGQFDVADPYQQGQDAFDTAYAAIERGVADWVPRIMKIT